MKRILILFAFITWNFSTAFAQTTDYRDIYSDTWVGVDALGRLMPTSEKVGTVKTDQRRVTGIFYITWHGDHLATLKSPYTADVTKVLSADSSARLDANHPLWTEGSYHWGEPEMGYFLSKDEYVIRKDMSMLADAGIDVLVMDVTNAVRYWSEWDALFSVMQKMKSEGNKVPRFCFWAFNGPVITVVQDLYEKIYKQNKYRDLWFYWDGKPLLLYNGEPVFDANGGGVENPNPNYDPKASIDPSNPHFQDPDYTGKNYADYTKEVKEYFTLRTMWWGYYKWADKRFVGTEDNWSFGYDLGDKKVRNMPPEGLASTHQGRVEEAAVTPAQHPISIIGKSWTRDKGEPALNEYDLPEPAYVPWLGKTVDNPEAYGIYFQDRWDEALAVDPQFLYINDWNEWTAGKYPSGKAPGSESPGPTEFLGRKNPFYFVDQYNAEFNRTIQPMKGGYTDNYYMQMAQNIRRYKGVRPIPQNKGYASIKIDASFQDWDQITTEFRDTKGDVVHRDYNGYGGLHYMNTSGRNDIITSKVAVDSKYIYFYAETDQPLTSSLDKNWMLLLIDADHDPTTGWYGYDYLINKEIKGSKQTTLMRYDASKAKNPWVQVATLDYSYTQCQLELRIPRKKLGLTGKNFIFDFKWSDAPADLIDPISLCTDGDTAPNRRFNYRYIWEE
ncbi:hypothetical protein [Parabacteroides sp. Marseille-P3160]|uniref:hypothetical protein n=1 Tax=Parabacteroides sp. Marseille-P3160 TaxID=1917887 RepID=UPI0009BC36B4|nr:hypothetical protein [Parabacteroides sp. Marseille-P3160]